MDSVVCSPSYHSQGSQGSSLQSTLVLIISLREASLKRCCCKMYRPPCKESGFLPVEFGIRENLSSACRIPLMIEIQKTSSTNKKHVQYMESGFQVVKSRIQQCFGFPHMGQRHRTGSPYKKTNFATRKSKKKRTDLTNGSLNAQKFLHLNPFLIWIIIIISCWSAVYTVIFRELL